MVKISLYDINTKKPIFCYWKKEGSEVEVFRCPIKGDFLDLYSLAPSVEDMGKFKESRPVEVEGVVLGSDHAEVYVNLSKQF